MDDRWQRLKIDLKHALDAFVRGDAEPYKRLWSHAGDVSIMGTFGGYAQGWDAVVRRLSWAADQYHDGEYDEYDLLTETVGTDLAYTAWREKISSKAADGTEVLRHRRGTQVFRWEGSAWRIVHEHTDSSVNIEVPDP